MRADEIADTPECRAQFKTLNEEQWKDFLAFIALPKKKQLALGRSMRHSATKGGGVVAQIPTCFKCGTTSVLPACRSCASYKQLAEYPARPGEVLPRTTGKQTNKPPSAALVQSIHEWARQHPRLAPSDSGSGTGSTGDRTPKPSNDAPGNSAGKRTATRGRGN